MLDIWSKILLLIPCVGFYFFFLPTHFHSITKAEKTNIKFSWAPLKIMNDSVKTFHKGILRNLVWTNFAFITSMIINMMRDALDRNLVVFLLSTSLLILLISTSVSTSENETKIGACAFLSMCLFAGNTGYIIFYDVSWFPSPVVGFAAFFLAMFFIPKVLLLFPK
jgi:hypothetical protein